MAEVSTSLPRVRMSTSKRATTSVRILDAEHCRLTLGAWSWAGVAGILATFDTELTELRPPELVHTFHRLARRWASSASPDPSPHGGPGAPAEGVGTLV
ncbi:hypothetical protein [Nocardia sp. NPDC050718]|uniref:hypothetical protein n=1 Tax=Nocardia sp. NPDC050718 TaxID=3155788 RepID=UPI0033F1CD9D